MNFTHNLFLHNLTIIYTLILTQKTMRQPNFYSAVFAIIKDTNWKTLMQQRQNTGFRDWLYQLPSGHVEWKEEILVAMKRELKEEINIDVELSDIKIIHCTHVICPDRIYINFYIEVLKYSWKIENLEPEKCSSLSFINIEEFLWNPDYKYENETLQHIKSWEFFSEKVIDKI